jgi:hypothetical protein
LDRDCQIGAQRGANSVSRDPWITTFTNWYEVWARQYGYATNVGMKIISEKSTLQGKVLIPTIVPRTFPPRAQW